MCYAKLLQRIYDDERNFSISCFWDGGVDWKLGDDMNGYTAQGTEETVKLAIDKLYDAHYAEKEAE